MDDLQCTGTKNGGNCLYGECCCEKGFVLQRLICLPGINHLYPYYLRVARMINAKSSALHYVIVEFTAGVKNKNRGF